MCSLRQSARSSGQHPQGPGVLEGGVALMAWGLQGYRLVVAERSSTALVLEVTLAKSLPNSYRIVQPQDASEDSLRSLPEIHFLQVCRFGCYAEPACAVLACLPLALAWG